MVHVPKTPYIHYRREEDRKSLDVQGEYQYPDEHELVTYFLPKATDPCVRYDVRRTGKHPRTFSRFKNSGYFNGYGMGHFNRYSTSEAEYGVGIEPENMAPPRFYK